MFFYVRNRETGSYEAAFVDWSRAVDEVRELNTRYQTDAWYITQVAPTF